MQKPPGLTLVVPVYNAGEYLERCLQSLADQSADRHLYDVVAVDDGSTDGSGRRLDDFAARHPDLVRVVHTENSGWPGRPRNIGTDLSTREYVFYCDADDWLMPDAVETVLERAASDNSDVVMVRAVGNRRRVPHGVYEKGDRCTTWRETPGVFTNLTCQKAFRIGFLQEHGIRFQEGRVRLEDFLFMTAAYLHAERISILGSRPLYVLERRDDGGNLTSTRSAESEYWRSVEAIIDIVLDTVEPGPARDVALDRVVRSELTEPLSRPSLLRKTPAVQAEAVAHARRLLETKVPLSAVARLSETTRARLDAVRRGDVAGILAQIEADAAVRLDVNARSLAWDGSRLEVEVRTTLQRDGATVALQRSGESWVLPRLDSPDLTFDLAGSFERTSVHLRLRHRTSAEVRRIPLSAQPLDGATGRSLDWVALAAVDAHAAAGGRPLEFGVWDALIELASCGFHRTVPLAIEGSVRVPRHRTDTDRVVRPYRTQSGRLAIVVRPAAPVSFRARLRAKVRRTRKSLRRKWDSAARPG